MESPKILVVDDDEAICNLVTRFLSKQNYQLKSAYDGKSALEIFDDFHPDLVVLDVNLPDALGYNLCEQMQSRQDVFILMLTSRSDVADKRKGFLKGADDYVTKPFNLEELEFRVKAILKRRRIASPEEEEDKILRIANLLLDPTRREVKINNKVIFFTNLEFNLLYWLAKEPGRVWTREELLKYVWGNDDAIGEIRVVDVHVGQIRRKLDKYITNATLIHTVRGFGYKFQWNNIN